MLLQRLCRFSNHRVSQHLQTRLLKSKEAMAFSRQEMRHIIQVGLSSQFSVHPEDLARLHECQQGLPIPQGLLSS